MPGRGYFMTSEVRLSKRKRILLIRWIDGAIVIVKCGGQERVCQAQSIGR